MRIMLEFIDGARSGKTLNVKRSKAIGLFDEARGYLVLRAVLAETPTIADCSQSLLQM